MVISKMTPTIAFLVMMMAYQVSSTPEENIIRSSNDVSNRIYKILGRGEGNVLFSPVSANVPLSLVYLAAKGKTADELKAGLNLSNQEEVKSGYRTLVKQLNDNKLKLATRLYPKTGFSLNPEFLTTAQRDFDSGIEQVNYNDAKKAATTINSFVEQKTNNKIHDLINPNSIDGSTAMIIVNAAHFKDSWRHPFSHTFQSDFYTSKNEKVKVQMMQETERYNFKVSESLNAKILQLPFQDEHYSMVIVLPNDVNGLQDLETKITSFDEVLKDLSYARVQVKIPKFKIETTLDLKPVLQNLGITKMFTAESDLSGLADNQPLYISSVLQKTYIDVNENGVEAAAATELGIMLTSLIIDSEPPQEFIADHPFLFTIMGHNLILFHGRVSNVKY